MIDVQLETTAGEHITMTAKRLVEAANRRGHRVSVKFNDVLLFADPGAKAADIADAYDVECKVRADEYRRSPAGIEAARKRAEEVAVKQGYVDMLFQRLANLEWTDLNAVVEWVDQLAEPSDDSGVTVPVALIVQLFRDHGYEVGANVGDKFNENDRENVARYIIGQALAGLEHVGAIHHICRKFVQNWRAKSPESPPTT